MPAGKNILFIFSQCIFRNRVIFPVLDVRGKVRGFGGRSLDGQEPKYLNSPETALYTKGQHLFGFAQAKDANMMRVGVAILIEDIACTREIAIRNDEQ